MNRDQARSFVTRVFTHSFDKERYRHFTLNLLNHVDESKAFARNSQYIKDAFKEHVSRFERIGTYTSPNREKLDVLVVHLTKESKLERARTAIRNFVADHLKDRDDKDAALVAFVSPSEAQWRFSYVKMEYASLQKESGKVGVEAKLTPARRFSYIVGEGESCHTAQSRFLPLLQSTESDPTLAEIEEAFSVEVVTKEFFTKYADLFNDIYKALEKLVSKDKKIRDEFEAKGVNTVEFAKKLMGQIVFLYFLQKKGWLGVEKGKDWGTGPHNFLRRLANGEYGRYENFFNDILEPLFYDTLATDRGHDAWCSRFKCRIPFLNGGLFEPPAGYNWRKTELLLPDRLFTNDDKFEEGIYGTGVLDVFDRYNFTVNEAEPLEKEVAIDPEMLGKVFENLIEENRRKGLGAYYTPREIVHYMCQETLINHLIASMGQRGVHLTRTDVETFVRLGEQISHYEAVEAKYSITMPKAIQQHARVLDEKLAHMRVCDPAVGSGAFPVGMMMEIVRCRCALTPYFNDFHERTPYHFKRHCIQNTIYGVDIDSGAVDIAKLRLWLSLVVDEEETKHIKPLPNLDFKIVTGNSLLGFPYRTKSSEAVEALKTRFFEETDHDRKIELKKRIEGQLAASLATSKTDLGYQVTFDFKIYFSEVFDSQGGFDVVIANPPYIDSENMTKTAAELRHIVQASYTMTKGNWDIYIAFYERALSLLGRFGVLSFITPDKWISKPFGSELRKRALYQMLSILKAGRSVFENVNVDAIVSVFTKQTSTDIRIAEFQNGSVVVKREVSKDLLRPPYALDWLFSDFAEILSRIESNTKVLSDMAECENACATSDAYKLQEFIEEEPHRGSHGQYLRIINTGTIGRFRSKWGLRPMVYLGDRYERPVVRRDTFLREFPNSYGKKSVKPKLIVKGLNLLDACLDEHGTVIPGKTTLMITAGNDADLRVILGIINSVVPFFYLKEKYPASSYNQGTTFTKEMINDLPFPTLDSKDRNRLLSIVEKILEQKERSPEANTDRFEGELDDLVCSLYGLSDRQVTVMREALKPRSTKARRSAMAAQ